MEIKIFDELTASKIAAGEVVERPLNVVKELLENSLDAGASRITVEIEAGGCDLIKVTDNGRGILGSELEIALERYATSKAYTVEDVYSAKTYGFRGEALAAISAVSEFNIKSVRSPEDALEISSFFGKKTSPKPAVIPQGTQVTVSSLFNNLPVRKKFLKSSKSCEQEIIRFVKQLSVHNAGKEFIVISDGKEVYRSYTKDSMLDIAKRIFSEKALVYSEKEYSYSKVKVCVSNPAIQRRRRDGILIGVNGRVIKDSSITQAVVQAYHRLMPAGVYPYAIVDITIEPSAVDVNIHPTKSEIRFEMASAVFSEVKHTVESALDKFTPSFYTSDISYHMDVEDHTVDDKSFAPIPQPLLAKDREDKNYSAADLSDILETEDILPSFQKIEKGRTYENVNFINSSDNEYEALAQLNNMYILCRSKAGDLLIVDQHVAHERSLYEKYMAQKMKAVPTITLFEPVVVHLLDDEKLFFDGFSGELLKFGYDFEYFGPNDIKITMVPVDVLKKDIKTEVVGIIHDAMELKRSRTADYLALTMSCRNAVKAGDPLSIYEMQQLINMLFKTKNPHTCPHGRPIIYKISVSELAKKFQR